VEQLSSRAGAHRRDISTRIRNDFGTYDGVNIFTRTVQYVSSTGRIGVSAQGFWRLGTQARRRNFLIRFRDDFGTCDYAAVFRQMVQHVFLSRQTGICAHHSAGAQVFRQDEERYPLD
jgi:hypothetical protein